MSHLATVSFCLAGSGSDTDYNFKNPLYSSVGSKSKENTYTNSLYKSSESRRSNTETVTSEDEMCRNSLYDSSKIRKEDEPRLPYHGPTEGYAELNHPHKTNPSSHRSDSYYSKIHGNTNAEEFPAYDVSIHGHPQTQPQTLPPHAAALYDTANYPSEPTHQRDCAEAADFIEPPSDSSLSSSVKPQHPTGNTETKGLPPLDSPSSSVGPNLYSYVDIRLRQ